MTTFEEAKTCPRCAQPGEEGETRPAPNMPRGTKVINIYCRNERCRWYNTPWVVQLNPDGTVPDAKDHRGEHKVYAGFEGHDNLATQIQLGVELERQRSLQPGAEVRNPRA